MRRLLTFAPDNRNIKVQAYWNQFALDGDRPAYFAGRGKTISPPPDDARDRYSLALDRGDYDEALRALAASPEQSFRDNHHETAKSDLQALAAYLKGDMAQARAFADAAVRFYSGQIGRYRPVHEAFTTLFLGRARALLGQKEEALRLGRRALELYPISRDHVAGPDLLREYATFCVLVGEKDEALARLEEMLSRPCFTSANDIRLDPLWRGLAGDPRSEAILTKAKPQ